MLKGLCVSPQKWGTPWPLMCESSEIRHPLTRMNIGIHKMVPYQNIKLCCYFYFTLPCLSTNFVFMIMNILKDNENVIGSMCVESSEMRHTMMTCVSPQKWGTPWWLMCLSPHKCGIPWPQWTWAVAQFCLHKILNCVFIFALLSSVWVEILLSWLWMYLKTMKMLKGSCMGVLRNEAHLVDSCAWVLTNVASHDHNEYLHNFTITKCYIQLFYFVLFSSSWVGILLLWLWMHLKTMKMLKGSCVQVLRNEAHFDH